MKLLLVSAVALSLLYHCVESSQPCTVCRDGTPVGIPEKDLDLPEPYASVQSCGALDTLVPLVLELDSLECELIQNVSTYCGCPVAATACQLCTGESVLEFPDLVVDFPLIPAGMLPATCEFAQAYLHSYAQGSEICLEQTINLQATCPCILRNETQHAAEHTDTGSNGEERSSCTLCKDGSNIAFPEKDITSMSFIGPYMSSSAAGFLPSPPANATLTCGLVSSLIEQVFDAGDHQCTEVQSILAGVCGCPSMATTPCDFCGDGDVEDPDRMVYALQDFGYPPATCGDISLFAAQHEDKSQTCLQTQAISNICGCNGGYSNYLGAKTMRQRTMLVWAPRVAGFLSILGSSFILWDGWKNYRRGTFTMLHEILGSLSFWDLMASVCALCSTLAVPKYNAYGEPTGILGAQGTEATCTAQGFFLQLGVVAVLYHIALSCYFLLVIRYGWQESRIRKFSKWFHLPLIPGLVLAFAGLPRYGNNLWGCYVRPPPLNDSYVDVLVFAIIPLSIAIVVTFVNMALVYCKVRHQVAAGNRWRISRHFRESDAVGQSRNIASRFLARMTSSNLGDGAVTNGSAASGSGGHGSRIHSATSRRRSQARPRPPSLERHVFWQSALYLSIFYMCWSFVLASLIKPERFSFPFWVATVAISPSQGFFNFLVYVRPRTVAYLHKKRRERQRLLQQRQTMPPPPNCRRSYFQRFFHCWGKNDSTDRGPPSISNSVELNGETGTTCNRETNGSEVPVSVASDNSSNRCSDSANRELEDPSPA